MRDSPNKFLYWILAASAVDGAVEALLPEAGGSISPVAFPYAIVCSVLFFVWCKAHSRALGIVAPAGSAPLCGLLAVIGVPLYFFRAFGFKRGLVGTIKATGFFVLMIIVIAAAKGLSGYVAHNNALHLTRGADAPLAGELSR